MNQPLPFSSPHVVGAVVIVPLLSSSGCLISETTSYRVVLNDNGTSGTLTIERHNLQSDQEDTTKQREDFDGLIRDWTSDEYLLNGVRQGYYSKDRCVSVQSSVPGWKESAIFEE